MTPRFVRLADIAPLPWRNGGGVARDLLAWPESDDWRLRISVAEIEKDGPFSAYPGIDRRFTVLRGGDVALTVDGSETLRRRGGPMLKFSGAATVSSRLTNGPSRVLNLLLRDLSGAMQPVVDGEPWRPAVRACGVYVDTEGRCIADGETTDMPAESLLWFPVAPASLMFGAAGALAPGALPGWWLEADIVAADA